MNHCNPTGAAVEPLDFDARYRIESMPGVAFWLKGYAQIPDGFPDYAMADYVDDPDRVVAVMVGDDREHTIDVSELTKISEDDYCPGCGQIGCGHS